MSTMDWFVIGVAPVEEVFLDLNNVAKQMMITTIVVAGLFILMDFSCNSIVRPIRNIAARFVALGRGGDLSQRITIEGNDEIGQYQRDSMALLKKFISQ